MFPIPETILDSLPDPILLLDSRRRVVAANRAAEDLLGTGLEGFDLARALRHPMALDAVDAVLEGNEAGREAEVHLPVPVPRAYSIRVVGLPAEMAGRDGRGIRAMLVMHDVTLARRAEQMRADFVANVSHELRTPLSALIGFIETLQGPAADDPGGRIHFLGIMQREAARMARLIDDLLSLSRVEVNEHVLPRGKADLGGIVAQVAELLQVKAERRGMTIRLDIPADLPPVMGAADELTQVFQNLIDNSIKYAREDTPIQVSAFAMERLPPSDRPGVAVTVADQSDGIPKDDLPRVTERFYRVDKARSRAVGGTGLGLAIVKHIVNRHRGRMMISSETNEGTTVTVMLPVCHKSVTDKS
jgi:two-component system phosphate regulon sensor histidine kinase PhoR